jgi:putative membrane protein insertion efficiency factor
MRTSSFIRLIVLGMVLAAGVALADGRRLAIGAIHAYQRTLSPLAERAGAVCRFSPSCSHYAELAIARDGLAAGGWKTLKRVASCNPWTKMGTVDQP